MSVEVTLNLPENLIKHAKRFGKVTNQNVEDVLVDTLEIMWPMLEDMPDTALYPPVSSLSNEEVLNLADAKMNEKQNARLSELQSKGKTIGLSADEKYELAALLRIYQIGQLRKSEAMVEAVNRGLRKPLSE
ncbi:MAG: hypothetical protein AB1757_21820 [Acidobacteriota bacterium]